MQHGHIDNGCAPGVRRMVHLISLGTTQDLHRDRRSANVLVAILTLALTALTVNNSMCVRGTSLVPTLLAFSPIS